MDEQLPTPLAAPSRRRLSRLVSVGAILGGVALLGGAVTAAALPTAAPAPDDTTAAPVEAVEVLDSYTPEQYDAFWGSGYSYEDALELAALWSTDEFTAKSRAGQLLLDGEPVPVEPSGSAEDAVALGELWETDQISAKARAGQLLLDGQPVPDAPAAADAGAS